MYTHISHTLSRFTYTCELRLLLSDVLNDKEEPFDCFQILYRHFSLSRCIYSVSAN